MPRRVCKWTPIEEDSPVYTPGCPDGEEWQLDEGRELYPFCHWCGGRIKVMPAYSAAQQETNRDDEPESLLR